MALYALYFEQLISAEEAEGQGNYRCLECKGPMQVRQGRRRRHFYHVKTSPSCRLYSKSEDHLLLQLQIQSLFSPGEIVLEKPFLSIGRIADLSWEKNKMIFEVQCSSMTQKEAEGRIADYASLGYKVIWLLDDRFFNRRTLQPAEIFLRETTCYYIHYQRMGMSVFYDQFELLQNHQRLRKGIRLPVTLGSPRLMPNAPPARDLPQQILKRQLSWPFFFCGDLFHKALLSKTIRPIAKAMQNWVIWEQTVKASPKIAASSWFVRLASHVMEWLIQKVNED